MRGADYLLKLRRSGYRPEKGVVVNLSELPRMRAWNDGLEDTGCLAIDVFVNEDLARCDWRCIIGLPVVIFGRNVPRILQAYEAIKKAGADRIIALRFDEDCGNISEFWVGAHNPWTEPNCG